MKKYIHEKRNQLKSALFHAGQITRQPELFETILDENGKLVDPSDIKRKNELAGAGLQYIMSIVDYYCTHRKSELQLVDGSAQRMKLPTLTWEMAIDMATAGIPGQRDRAEAAILNLRAMQKPVFFYDFDYDKNGLSYSMVPFIIDLTFDNDEKLTTERAAKIARIIKARKKHIAKNNLEKLSDKKGNFKGSLNQQYKTIKYIDIQFAKPLYEGFFRKEGGHYSFPTGMYAQFFEIMNNTKKESNKLTEKNKGEFIQVDNEPYIDFYCRFARYIQLHNNLEKGKDHTVIYKTIEEILIDVQPSLIRWVNGKPYIHDTEKAKDLIANAFSAMLQLDGFYAYPALEGYKDGKAIIGLYKDRHEAHNAIFELPKKMGFKIPDIC